MSARDRAGGGPVAILGAGRAGEALATALAAEETQPLHVWSRNGRRAAALARRLGATRARDLAAVAREARIVLIAVRDDSIAEVAASLSDALPEESPLRAALHTSGLHGSALLDPLRELGIAAGVFHPMLSLHEASSAEGIFQGAHFSVSGDRIAVAAARRLASRLGARVVKVEERDRPLLHLAAVMAAGDLTALLGSAEELMRRAGVPDPAARRIVSQLAESALSGFGTLGASDALTGPLPRRDAATIELHARAARRLPRSAANAIEAHRTLLAAGAELLRREGRMTAREMRELLAPFDDES